MVEQCGHVLGQQMRPSNLSSRKYMRHFNTTFFQDKYIDKFVCAPSEMHMPPFPIQNGVIGHLFSDTPVSRRPLALPPQTR